VPSLGTIVRGTIQAMGWTLRNAFRAKNTIPYPRQKRPIPGQWRAGSFALTFDPVTGEEFCIGCRLCEYICPSEIIRVTLRKGEARKNGVGATYCDTFTLDYQACMQCELCVQVCPTDAIVMTRALAPTALTRDGLFLSKARLMEQGRALLETKGLASEATGTALRAWTDAARGAPAPPAEKKPEDGA
jgi:NADH-quinone oxidoreductase subunit I